jgi:MFS family permease
MTSLLTPLAMPDEPLASQRRASRTIAAAPVGTIIEWYDFFLYGIAAALVFPHVFFPQADPYSTTLLAFSTYFVGFLARPLGGIIFGYLGDRFGRKASLVTTLLLMGIATAAVGLMPAYDQIGIAGGMLLVVMRALQGIGVGGEWGGAGLLAGESTDPRRRGFAMSWPQFGGAAGLLLASAAVALMARAATETTFLVWVGASRSWLASAS